MNNRPAHDTKALEARFRGLALEDSLKEAAEALAREVGAGQPPDRRRRGGAQFPFRAALAQRVKAMEARYGELLEAAPDAMIVANGQGEIVLVNTQAEVRLGYGREELLGQALSSVLDGALGTEAGEGKAAGRPVGGREMRAVRKDGVHFPVEVMTSTVEGIEGPLVTVAFRDVSARKAAERRLARLEARARTLLEHAPDPMLVVNKRGTILLVNARLRAVFGYEEGDVLGHPAGLLVPEGLLERLVGEDGGPAYRAIAESAGVPAGVTARCKDGTPLAVEMTLGALKSSDGVLFVAAFRELGARGGSAGAEDPRIAMLDAAPDALLAIDRRGDIVSFNRQAERRFGYSRDEVLGLPITRIFPEGFADRFVSDPLAAAEASLALEIGTGIELQGVARDGAAFHAELMLSRLETADGPLTMASVRDGSLRRAVGALEEPMEAGAQVRSSIERRLVELTRTSEELAQFAEVSANQLKEPVRRLSEDGTRLAAELAEVPGVGQKPGELARSMVEEAARMQALVTDLLGYSLLGRKPLKTRRIQAQAVLDAAAAGLHREIADSGAVIASDPLPDIECDPEEIELLFRNLIVNAIAYGAGEPPRVHVSAAPNSAGDWVFAVADNGIGIERKYFERVFQPFQRLHRHAAIARSGIGLALCRRIAERHGGRMWVDSRAGLGSTFYLALPARRPE